jgi:nitrous-oxide reductase
MRKLIYITLAMFLIFAYAGLAAAQEPSGGYKAGYEKQMQVVADTQAIINSVVQWLKEHNFDKYEYAKIKVEDAFEQAGFAEESKKKAEAFAANGNWMQAYFWANQVWQYQVKVADSGLRAKQIVEDAEKAAQQAK